ncbi:ABC transporter ATP-binding protein [Sanguibacter sp. 4.1]|uniref:ABC transporter ATP-binding protein n=1 Tax=Sanguibacter biliveldensis TaxID=3030830 RepID=A0AAF0Z700_9MICO|nr:ABC transporter ATP-binding protein [Sanguibacter sp. 4.1]WPF81268.1 ABC transporter ATP-binding protein [Sanguibacter sp. 4.1]
MSATQQTGPVLRAHAVSRTFSTPAGDVHAVSDVSLEVGRGELVVLRGTSGSGKSTLLHLLGGIDEPTSGHVEVDGERLDSLDTAGWLRLRTTGIGYVLQSFGLVPVLSAAENVEIPLRLLRTEPRERDARVREVLSTVGLERHAHQRPYELSGGQQQRVGIARAIVARPSILLADEPTGQLDSATAATVMDLLHDLVHQEGVAAVVSTHDPVLAARADRVITLHDGRVS